MGKRPNRPTPNNGHDPACFCGCGNGERTNGRVLPGKQAGRVVGTLIAAATTAHGLYGAVDNPGLAAGIFPGREEDAAMSMPNIVDVRRHEERDRRSQDMDEGTRDKGYSSGYDSI